VYQDSPSGTALDPDFQTSYGIGPGCTSSVGEAVPPVRLKAFAEAFEVDGKRNLFSVCDDSYAEALRAIADLIRDRIKPPCMPACVADQDPLTPEIEPLCILTQRVPQGGGDFVEEGVPLCLDAAGTIPEGWDLCYLALGDRENVTATPDDDLSKTCRDDGWNLEFDLVRREGVTVPGGTTISARCALSQDPFRDCPDLPG
jgi:hypothetical protein